MAIYNKRASLSQEQFTAHFQARNSVVEIFYGIIRFLIIVVENLYCIPSYLVLSWLVLLPTSWLRSDLYSRFENYLYNSLIFIVSSWSLAAGLTVVESGDDYKHLIEEPEKNYPDGVSTEKSSLQSTNNNGVSSRKQQVTLANSCSNINGNGKRYLDSNCRVVINGYADQGINGPHQVNGHSNINTRTRSSSKLKNNAFVANGTNNNNNHHNGGDRHPIMNGQTMSNGIQENNFNVKGETHDFPLIDDNEIYNNHSNNNNNSHNKRCIIAKQNGHSPSNNHKLVTKDTSLTSRIIKEQRSLKIVQAKPRILLLCNHISTADVPLIMQSFSTLTNQSILWVLDAQFKMTNFGVVCGSHGDFFVAKNSYVDGSLREHVLKYPDRNLLVLFPEGGFLRKRIEGSNRYATRNGLPHTKNVTHPRFGAFKDLTDPSVGITHIVDATLIYDDIKNPISILNIAFGNKKEPAILHLKVYNRSEINPTEEWLRNIWLEKDKLLTQYYEDKASVLKQFAATFRVATLDWFKVLSVHLFYLLVCYLAIFRLFNATSVTMLKARELYYSNI